MQYQNKILLLSFIVSVILSLIIVPILKRLKVGNFKIEDTIIIDENVTKEDIEEKLITIEELFKNKEKIDLNSKKLILFLNGVKLNENKEDEVYRIYSLGKFIGLGIIKDKLLKRDIVL